MPLVGVLSIPLARLLSNASSERLARSIVAPANTGSFDYAEASLREASAPLRMTIRFKTSLDRENDTCLRKANMVERLFNPDNNPADDVVE
jgi:hypothetical protein